jgi:hypothetical protein
MRIRLRREANHGVSTHLLSTFDMITTVLISSDILNRLEDDPAFCSFCLRITSGLHKAAYSGRLAGQSALHYVLYTGSIICTFLIMYRR